MSDDLLEIKIYDEDGKLAHEVEVNASAPVELGRQMSDETNQEPAPYALVSGKGGRPRRLIVAAVTENTISRRHVLVERVADDVVRLTNKSHIQPLGFDDGDRFATNGPIELKLPFMFRLGKKSVRIASPDPLESLAEPTMAPGDPLTRSADYLTIMLPPQERLEDQFALPWLKQLLDVLQVAATSPEFCSTAAQAVVNTVRLDAGAVILKNGVERAINRVKSDIEVSEVVLQDGTRLEVQSHKTSSGVKLPNDWRPSRRVVQRVFDDKRTKYSGDPMKQPKFSGDPPSGGTGSSSYGMQSYVGAPILSSQREVIGVLYGESRRPGEGRLYAQVTRAQAMLVETIAHGVAAGLARLEQEQEALSARVKFEQFFTRDLVRQLELDPDWQRGRYAEVSVLFCDICGFSRITENLGAERSTDWLGDTLETLSKCVWKHDGVVIDYVGDEIAASWGAPQHQPDHAILACRAAIEMLEQLRGLNERWQQELSEPTAVGIGINSGEAWVGNIGSRQKFKYGPRGSVVNIGSRVQGANKYLQTTLLITGETCQRIGSEFATRRLCRVRLVNLEEAIDLYELVAEPPPNWADLKTGYEAALDEFLAGRFRETAGILGKLLVAHPNDAPSLVLMSRAVQCLVDPPPNVDPVWILPGK